MIPFRVSAAAQNANASPSVSLERGNYRLRAPRTSRASAQPPPSHGTRIRSAGRQDHARLNINLTLLILLLMIACLFCFAAACHLYSTRWDSRSMDQPAFLTNRSQVHGMSHDEHQVLDLNPHEKFMTYLPHSGFHNQRIALENALVLSTLLNRTLVIPPIRLGRKPISYVNYELLLTSLALGDKEGLSHCSAIPSYMFLPPECLGYFDYTHIPWNWLVNITQHRPQIYQRKLSPLWIRHELRLNDTDVLALSDESRYHYQYHDTLSGVSDPRERKYLEKIYIYDFANCSERLLQFGTLFGSSRLVLRNHGNIDIRTRLRRSMAFSNPALIKVVERVREVIGTSYLGAHIRMSDGPFEQNSASNIREILWKLVQMSSDRNISQGLESGHTFASNGTFFAGHHSLRSHLITPSTVCRGQLYQQPNFIHLNVPLFISTDAENPRDEVSLSALSGTFPCILFISDFAAQLEPLHHIRNEDDGMQLAPFLIPFLDAMIVGHALKVVVTEGSTFGKFIEAVLWKVHHGEEVALESVTSQ